MLVGIGDDAAVVEPERNRVEVLTVDAIVDGIHFDRAFVPPDAIGHRALAVNLSDLAAMGAAPRLALLSFALPPTLPVADFDGMIAGLTNLAAKHRMHVAGGNLTRTHGPLTIDVTAIGTIKRRQALTRGGARAGDHLYVSGTIGGAHARVVSRKSSVNSQQSSVGSQQSSVASPSQQIDDFRLTTDDSRLTTDDSRLTTDDSGLTTDDRRLTTTYLYPSPRVRLGTLLARNRAASACIDLSDGLADAVRQLTEASGVGAIIDADALPIEPAARAWFEAHGGDAVAACMASDDYELLVATRPRLRGRFAAAVRHADVPLTRIGICTPDRAVLLRQNGADAPLPRGYTHFGR